MVTTRQNNQLGFYRIMIEGQVRGDWSDWLEGMQISITNGAGEPQNTILAGKVTDQAALRGLLCRLWDMNLTIISMIRLDANAGTKEGPK